MTDRLAIGIDSCWALAASGRRPVPRRRDHPRVRQRRARAGARRSRGGREPARAGARHVARPPAPAAAHPEARPPRVVRRADARDLARDEQNQVREREAHRLCLIRIRERRMTMKLVQGRAQLRRQQGGVLFLRRGSGRLPRAGARPGAEPPHPHRDEADRRAATRPSCSAASGRAAASSAARRGCASSRRCRCRWRRSRACRSTRPSSRACAGGSSAACATSTTPTSSCARAARRSAAR